MQGRRVVWEINRSLILTVRLSNTLFVYAGAVIVPGVVSLYVAAEQCSQTGNVFDKRVAQISELRTLHNNASSLHLASIFSTIQYALLFKRSEGNLGP